MLSTQHSTGADGPSPPVFRDVALMNKNDNLLQEVPTDMHTDTHTRHSPTHTSHSSVAHPKSRFHTPSHQGFSCSHSRSQWSTKMDSEPTPIPLTPVRSDVTRRGAQGIASALDVPPSWYSPQRFHGLIAQSRDNPLGDGKVVMVRNIPGDAPAKGIRLCNHHNHVGLTYTYKIYTYITYIWCDCRFSTSETITTTTSNSRCHCSSPISETTGNHAGPMWGCILTRAWR